MQKMADWKWRQWTSLRDGKRRNRHRAVGILGTRARCCSVPAAFTICTLISISFLCHSSLLRTLLSGLVAKLGGAVNIQELQELQT